MRLMLTFVAVLSSAVPVPATEGMLPATSVSDTGSGTTDLEREREELRQARTRGAIRAIASAVMTRSLDEPDFRYPAADSIDALAAILEPDYIRDMPRQDAWNGKLRYVVAADGTGFRVVSAGPDGKPSVRNLSMKTLDSESDDLVFQNDEFVHPKTPSPVRAQCVPPAAAARCRSLSGLRTM